MEKSIQEALVFGVERVAAWSTLLDDINVFPVADGDTGRNLIASLSPLRQISQDREDTIRRLLISARGNSGNIAARFFSGLLVARSVEAIPEAASLGRDMAWQAIHDPVTGTMLTVFDKLVDVLERDDVKITHKGVSQIIAVLEKAVWSTPELLPKLKIAGVVDSGALGMYIFLEGFFMALVDKTDAFKPVTETFTDMLSVSPSFNENMEDGYCVDMVVQVDGKSQQEIEKLSKHGESIVVIPHDNLLKIHLHTADREEVKREVESFGDILEWSDDNLGKQIVHFGQKKTRGCIHIMTDAAGSLTREDSVDLGITLLDSYIMAGDKTLPETLFSPSELYKHMRDGVKVSTSQASVFERHQYYQNILNQHKKTIYLCVGSVFTGNYDVAMAWKKKNDPDDRLTVIDTTTASGRLGTIALVTAKYSTRTDNPDAVIEFAKKAIDQCEEYVFLDKLEYLAAGGRLSKTSAFFGDMLHMKPIISPMAEGAKKVGVVRNQKDQMKFAFEKLDGAIKKDSEAFIMLEYSDNRPWVEETVMREVQMRYPAAEVKLQPLSLTSGVHMGPGTWAVAFFRGGKKESINTRLAREGQGENKDNRLK
jgi:DegV family protein with EDD domain